MQYFVQQNHCNPQPVRESGGHAWSGGRRVMFIGDKPRNDVCATETMCRFFFSHPKQHPAPPDNVSGTGQLHAAVATSTK